MKKLAVFLMAITGLLLTSCSPAKTGVKWDGKTTAKKASVQDDFLIPEFMDRLKVDRTEFLTLPDGYRLIKTTFNDRWNR